MSRLTSAADVVFRATSAVGPPEVPDVESMGGLLINTIPVRVRLEPDDTWARAAARLQDAQSAVLDHQYLGLHEIQAEIGVRTLFDTAVAFESYPVGESRERPGAPALVDVLSADATHFPLALVVVPGKVIRLRLDYRTDVFDQVDDIGETLLALLRDCAGEPDGRVFRAAASPAASPAATPVRADGATLPELFARQVARTPDAEAVVCGETSMTYAELAARSDALARLLVERGAGPERFVAIMLPRSADLVVTVLAVLKSGAAYVPLDPAHPADRVAFVVSDVGAELVVTTSALRDRVAGVPALVLDDERVPARRSPVDVRLRDAHPAYVIHTSGSTGLPKGVVVPHSGAVALSAAQRARLDVGPGDRVLLFASAGFDASVWEWVMALLSGACAVVAEQDEVLGGRTRDLGITHATLPPSVLASLPEGALPSLRTLVVAGEACPPALVDR
ncbi:AMP-binding protein, partial [Saccharothrix sp. MB29]|nr:AMP-binding protein [Saccharothrix sp. MB29]